MVEEVAGESLVAPALDLGQPAFDLREGGTRGKRPDAKLAGEDIGGEGSAAGGKVFGHLQHAKRYLKIEIGRGRHIMRAVSSHDCTSVAVVVRSSPCYTVGAALIPLRD
jgi:hypothetical protein